MYLLNGYQRFALPGIGPNETALVAAIIAILLVDAINVAAGVPQHSRSISTVVVLAAALMAVFFMLAASYSRGGIIALAIALGWLTHLRRTPLRWRFVLAAALSATVFAMPGLASRFPATLGIGSDASVGNRLVLWRGVCSMIADNFPHGCSAAGIGVDFQRWYQPIEHVWLYQHAVNTFLTVYARHGFWLFIVAAFAVLFPLFACGAAAARERRGPALFLNAVLLAVVIASLFSTMPDLLLFGTAAAALLVYTGSVLACPVRRKGIALLLAPSAGAALATSLLLAALPPAIGIVFRAHPVPHHVTLGADRSAELWLDRSSPSIALIILDEGQMDDAILASRVARGLNAVGYTAIVILSTSIGADPSWNGVAAAVLTSPQSSGIRSLCIIGIGTACNQAALLFGRESDRPTGLTTSLAIMRPTGWLPDSRQFAGKDRGLWIGDGTDPMELMAWKEAWSGFDEGQFIIASFPRAECEVVAWAARVRPI